MAKAKKKVPEFLRMINTSTLEDFMATADVTCIRFNEYSQYFNSCSLVITAQRNQMECLAFSTKCTWNKDVIHPEEGDNPITVTKTMTSSSCEKYKCQLLYIDTDATVWTAELELNLPDHKIDTVGHVSWPDGSECKRISLSSWEEVTKLQAYDMLLQRESEVREILEKADPELVKFADDSGADYGRIAMAPQMRILSEKGFVFVEKYLTRDTSATPYRSSEWNNFYNVFNRLCKRGTDLKSVLQIPEEIHSVIKLEESVEKLDSVRKMCKIAEISKEDAFDIITGNYEPKNVDQIYNILKVKYEEKPVFTASSLMKYLIHLDTYEAIIPQDALELLSNYLNMCSKIGKKPVLDGDSLKREHDVTRRISNIAANECYRDDIKQKADEMGKYSYSERKYFIRPVRDLDELIEEGKQQNSCIAETYPGRIKYGWSVLFVMREVANPDKSFATIELNPQSKKLGLCMLGFNHKVSDPEHLAFLDRWLKVVQYTA